MGTFPLFQSVGKPVMVFMEEPENHLHPGLQRRLIETWGDMNIAHKYGYEHSQFFITTHSNHIIDMCLDTDLISIYKMARNPTADSIEDEAVLPNYSITNVCSDDKAILAELGARPSSVCLSNCTIWVEGITDRLYIRRYLNIYQEYLRSGSQSGDVRTFLEDRNFSFVEFSGGNITHWSFLDNDDQREPTINYERLCATLFLITDRDTGKEARHQRLHEALGDRFYVLPVREMDNMVSDGVLKQVIADIQRVKESERTALIEQFDFCHDDYKHPYLGSFLDEQLAQKGIKPKRKYAAESGTIDYKLDFCQKVCSRTEQYEDLSEEIIDLCRRIYEFIKDNNS